tara:strand:+ start:5304 stop:6197 length:894 start_codon:yes stop_codon:yes gene_type:complete
MYYNENTTTYLDGKWLLAEEANTSLYAQTLHYGNGVFEGIRAYQTEEGNTLVFKALEHYERLLDSAQKMHISVAYTAEQLVQLTYELLDKNNLKDAYIRPLIYLDPNMGLTPVENAHVFIAAWEWDKYLGHQLLNVTTSSYCRPHPKSCHVEAKTVGHYTNSILATTEAKQKGYDEALLLDHEGFVAEAPGANFFFEKDGKLYTPALGNILPGITRKTVFELADQLHLEVVEGKFTLEDVYAADSAFFTGTAVEVAGIAALDDYKFPLEWEDSLGYLLNKMYTKCVTANEPSKLTLV